MNIQIHINIYKYINYISVCVCVCVCILPPSLMLALLIVQTILSSLQSANQKMHTYV